MNVASLAEHRARLELEAKLTTSVARGVFVGETVASIEGALEATGDPVDAALWAIADLLEDACEWSPQEVANAAAAVKAEVQRRNRRAGR